MQKGTSKEQLVAAAADAIEKELRAIGYWWETPPAPEKMAFKRAFGMDTLSFTQWIQFVLLVRVRELLATGSALPSSSAVGTIAVREFDGLPEAERLTQLLCEFDAAVEGGKSRRGRTSR